MKPAPGEDESNFKKVGSIPFGYVQYHGNRFHRCELEFNIMRYDSIQSNIISSQRKLYLCTQTAKNIVTFAKLYKVYFFSK